MTFSSPVKRSKIAGYLDLRSSRTAGQLGMSALRDSHQLVPSVVKPKSSVISCKYAEKRVATDLRPDGGLDSAYFSQAWTS